MKFILAVTFYYLVTTINAQSSSCTGMPNGVFLNDISSCDAYVVCMNGEAIPGSCGEFHFDEPSQSCVWPEDSDCFVCPPDGFHRFPTRLCNEFIQCFGGQASIETCPGDLTFSNVTGECVQDSGCVNNPCPPTDTPSNPIFVPDEENCSLYSVCVSGDLVQRDCGELFFNPDNNLCDHPENVDCPNAPPTEEPAAVDCPASGVVLVPHPTDCNLFYICTNGTPTSHGCAEGYNFDSVRLTCDIPERAICYGAR